MYNTAESVQLLPFLARRQENEEIILALFKSQTASENIGTPEEVFQFISNFKVFHSIDCREIRSVLSIMKPPGINTFRTFDSQLESCSEKCLQFLQDHLPKSSKTILLHHTNNILGLAFFLVYNQDED